LGVGPDVRVALCVNRSLAMLVALLGILKAGGTYVPLDPIYPKRRVAFMLEDSQATLLLTQESLRDHLNFEISNLKLVCVDTLLDAARTTQHASRRRTRTKDENDRASCFAPHVSCVTHDNATSRSAIRPPPSVDTAYLIYTSGSTGKPKGVAIPHRAVVNFLTSMAHEPGLAANDVVVAVTTLSFDIAVLELLLPLTRGARVVIASHDETVDGR